MLALVETRAKRVCRRPNLNPCKERETNDVAGDLITVRQNYLILHPAETRKLSAAHFTSGGQ